MHAFNTKTQLESKELEILDKFKQNKLHHFEFLNFLKILDSKKSSESEKKATLEQISLYFRFDFSNKVIKNKQKNNKKDSEDS